MEYGVLVQKVYQEWNEWRSGLQEHCWVHYRNNIKEHLCKGYILVFWSVVCVTCFTCTFGSMETCKFFLLVCFNRACWLYTTPCQRMGKKNLRLHIVPHFIIVWTSCMSVMKMLLVGVRFAVLCWLDDDFMYVGPHELLPFWLHIKRFIL